VASRERPGIVAPSGHVQGQSLDIALGDVWAALIKPPAWRRTTDIFPLEPLLRRLS